MATGRVTVVVIVVIAAVIVLLLYRCIVGRVLVL